MKIMKLLSLLLLLALPVVAQAQFNFTTNSGAITITAYTGSGGAVTIPATTNGYPVTSIGAGAFADSGLTNVTIPNSVLSIGDGAFEGCTNLPSVTIPNSVTSIEENVFTACFSLTNITVAAGDPDYSSVNGVLFNQAQTTLIAYPVGLVGGYTIPNNVTSIGIDAFESAERLTSVTIPNSVTGIGDGAFFACDSLTSVTIPNSVTSIGYGAFLACTNLTSAYFLGNAPPDSNAGIFTDAPATVYYLSGTTGWGSTFGGAPAVALTSQAQFTFTTNSGAITITGYTGSGGAVFIPVTINGYPVTGIGDNAFGGASLTSATIPNSVTNIGEFAFEDCFSLTSVMIPNSVTTIGVEAFTDTGLTSVTIPNSVTNLGYYTFQSCPRLTNINVVADNPDYSSANGVLFDQAQATLIEYPGGLDGGYTIPNSVTTIEDSAFNNCLGLTSVTIGNSVTSIGYTAFQHCTSLTSVTIPNSVTNIGEQAFTACSSLTTVTIPNSVTSIGDLAFWACTSLTSAYFLGDAPPDDGTVFSGDPATVYYLAGTTGWGSTFGTVPAVAMTSQAQFTFTTNSGAITITGYSGSGGAVLIPVTINGYPVTGIGEGAFVHYLSLTSVTIPNSITNIGGYAFQSCYSLTNITVVAGNPDYSSVNGVLFDQTQATLIAYPGGLDGGYTIPSSVTTIGDGAFIDCLGLTSVTIPSSVTGGDYAFFGCFSLTNITVMAGNPDYSSVNGVLFDQAQATLIECPEGLHGSYTIPNSVTSIGVEAFENSRLTSVTIPDSVISIGEEVFSDCTNLTSVTIPNSVTSIGVGTFASCLGLTSVTIPNSVTNIGDYAFLTCSNLTSAYFLGNAPPDDGTVFQYCNNATVYYLAGTTGWGSTFGGVPALLWNPQAQVPGVTASQFGFGITGPANTAIVVEACTNLANPVWLPVATNTLGNLGTGTFSDPQTGIYPARYYRFSAP